MHDEYSSHFIFLLDSAQRKWKTKMPLRDEKKKQTHQSFIDAAFALSYEKGCLSNVSLRELTQKVDVVPATFYRHFDDMQQLGLELVDRSSNHVRNIFYQFAKMAIHSPSIRREQRMQYFFQSIETSAALWHFFITERMSGQMKIRQAIYRERDFLLQDIVHRMSCMSIFEHLDATKMQYFAELIMQYLLDYATDWLEIQWIDNPDLKLQKRYLLLESSIHKIQFLYEGLHP